MLLLPMPQPRRTPGLLLALLLVALLWCKKSSSDFHMTVLLCCPGGPTAAGLTGRVWGPGGVEKPARSAADGWGLQVPTGLCSCWRRCCCWSWLLLLNWPHDWDCCSRPDTLSKEPSTANPAAAGALAAPAAVLPPAIQLLLGDVPGDRPFCCCLSPKDFAKPC